MFINNFLPPTASCIVTRLENILLAEDVSPSFIHKQITNIREQLLFAAKKMQELKNVDQQKVLQFFQSFGYDTGDLDIFHHWGLYCWWIWFILLDLSLFVYISLVDSQVILHAKAFGALLTHVRPLLTKKNYIYSTLLQNS